MSGGPVSLLQRIACEWAVRSFGMKHVAEPQVRAVRHVEEAIEVCQAFDVPKEQILAAVEMVYAKPKGEPLQELGGSLMTAVILCEAIGVEAELVLEKEVRRVLEKDKAPWSARNQSKLDAGLDGGVKNLDTPTRPPVFETVFESSRDPRNPEKVRCVIDGKEVTPSEFIERGGHLNGV